MKKRIIGGLAMFIVISAVTIVVTIRSDATKASIKFLMNNSKVQLLLGQPLKISSKWFDGGYVKESKTWGKAKLSFDISGPRGKGTAVIQLDKNVTWHIRNATVILDSRSKPVVLVKNSVEMQNDSE